MTLLLDTQRSARAARAELEDVLAGNGWWWSPRLSAWLDVLVILEEAA